MPSLADVKTAVVGTGYMGGGIAQVLANAGHRVALADVDAPTALAARERLILQAALFESKALMPAGSSDRIRANLIAAQSIEEAVADADYVAEAVPEVLEIKAPTLRRISHAAPADSVIGTNTSAIPIEELSQYVQEPARFLGVHWMNPAPFIPGVELIASRSTSDESLDFAEQLIRSIGKITTRVTDAPGFVANRLQFALYKEAVRIVEEGLATPAQIDEVVSNAFGFRLAVFGPFAIGDMAGLDVYNSSYLTLEKAFGERFAAPESLVTAVGRGDIGLKSGHGFLEIPETARAALLVYRDTAYARLLQLRDELGPPPGL